MPRTQNGNKKLVWISTEQFWKIEEQHVKRRLKTMESAVEQLLEEAKW
jgi:hypothetical protein